jgi:hypothetical protein
VGSAEGGEARMGRGGSSRGLLRTKDSVCVPGWEEKRRSEYRPGGVTPTRRLLNEILNMPYSKLDAQGTTGSKSFALKSETPRGYSPEAIFEEGDAHETCNVSNGESSNLNCPERYFIFLAIKAFLIVHNTDV